MRVSELGHRMFRLWLDSTLNYYAQGLGINLNEVFILILHLNLSKMSTGYHRPFFIQASMGSMYYAFMRDLNPFGLIEKHAIHYSDVIIGAMASQITSLTFPQQFIRAQIKENINAPRHLPLCGHR